MAAKSKSQVANDKTPFWTYPRTSLDDGICYHIRDQRKTKHADIEILEDHPLAKSDPVFENMVFVSREPADREGILVKDWYVPKTLVDDLLSVSKTGAGARASLLHPVGTEAPEGDSRITLLGEERRGKTFSSVAWVTNPGGGGRGRAMLELTVSGGSEFTGDEVYLDMTSWGNIVLNKYEDGVITESLATGVFKIVRHVSATKVQVNVPTYDASAALTGTITGTTYDAKYILEGTTDSEDAPGILRGKFHVRNFNYRLGDPGVASQLEDTLGIIIQTETKVVPATWSTTWATDFPTASTADCDSSISFAPISELVTQRTKQSVIGSPDQDNITWDHYESISVPRTLWGVSLLWAWADASNGDYYAYDDDIGLDTISHSGGQRRVQARTTRRVVKRADIVSTLTGAGWNVPLFQIGTTSYTLAFMSWAGFAGSNTWAKARVRTWNINGVMIPAQISVAVENQRGAESPSSSVTENQQIGRPVLNETADIASWDGNTYVKWYVRVQKSRFCYWIIDLVEIKLPLISNYQVTG